MRRSIVSGLCCTTVLLVGALSISARPPGSIPVVGEPADRELARLLVNLELRTRGALAKRYVAADAAHRAWLAHELLLPAAVADEVFHEVVPEATGGRAWVKMIVDEPRNRHNIGDDTTVALLGEIKSGKTQVSRTTAGAYYYGEPIKAASTCLACHGEPRGARDPFFPKYTKNGWKAGEIVGAVIARVAPHATGG